MRAARRAHGRAGSPRGPCGRVAARPRAGRSGPGRSSAWSSTSGRFVAADHDHAGRRVEPVHLGQDLVQRLLALVVAAAEAADAARARAPDRVELVDEHDRRRCLLRLRRGRARARRRHRRSPRRTPTPPARRTARPPRRRPPVRAGSCRSRADRRAARRAACGRPASGTAPACAGSRRPRQLRLCLVDPGHVRERDPVARRLVTAAFERPNAPSASRRPPPSASARTTATRTESSGRTRAARSPTTARPCRAVAHSPSPRAPGADWTVIRVRECRDLGAEPLRRRRAVVAQRLREGALDRRALRGDRLDMVGPTCVRGRTACTARGPWQPASWRACSGRCSVRGRRGRR